MSLSWKDAVGTVLVIASVFYSYAKVKAFSWADFGGWRAGMLMLLLLGIGACIVIGTGATPDKNNWTTLASVIGGIGFFLVVAGLIFNSKVLFIAMSADVVLLWVVTTLHHLIQKGA